MCNLLLHMAAPGAPIASDTFLTLFGTPTLLWRVLNSVGYVEPPRYVWSEVDVKDMSGMTCESLSEPMRTILSGRGGVLSRMDRPRGKVPKW